MKAITIINKALTLLGLSDTQGNANDGQYQRIALNALNFIYSDLFYKTANNGFVEIKTPSDEVNLPERILNDVVPYGVASFIAAAIDDGEKQQYFSSIYNQKRKSMTTLKTIEDVIPTGE